MSNVKDALEALRCGSIERIDQGSLAQYIIKEKGCKKKTDILKDREKGITSYVDSTDGDKEGVLN